MQAADCFLWQEREDGCHAPPGIGPNRGKLADADLPPGCRANFGEPLTRASPFVQVHLPMNMKHNGRKSRYVSFSDAASAGPRCTVRSKDAAIRSALAWSWDWYNSLSQAEASAVRTASDPAERQATERQTKRLRVN